MEAEVELLGKEVAEVRGGAFGPEMTGVLGQGERASTFGDNHDRPGGGALSDDKDCWNGTVVTGHSSDLIV